MNAHVSEEDAQILSAILSMAHSLNLDTVVEGIECEEQQDLLRKQVCHEVQGFYYARPMPAADLAALVQNETLSLEPLGYIIDRSKISVT
jgi:EAL domain-containing protein (putative c-di-GMP-specific phosphodiesterase class I)